MCVYRSNNKPGDVGHKHVADGSRTYNERSGDAAKSQAARTDSHNSCKRSLRLLRIAYYANLLTGHFNYLRSTFRLLAVLMFRNLLKSNASVTLVMAWSDENLHRMSLLSGIPRSALTCCMTGGS